MKQSCTSTFRRSAAVGAAVAIVAASSAFGIGATAAVAAPADTTSATATGTTESSAATTASDGSTTAADPTATTPGTGPDAGSPQTVVDPAAPADPEPADQTSTDPTAAPADGSQAGDAADATDGSGAMPAGTTAGTATDVGPGSSATSGTATPTTSPAAAADASPTASTPVTWAEPSSEDEPIELTATAGQPFSYTFVAQGGDGPLEYLFNPLSFYPSNDPDGWSWDEQTGVLTGSPKNATVGPVRFEVTATDQHQTAVQYVEITIEPGAPVGVAVVVGGPDARTYWTVEADGTVRRWNGNETDGTVVTEIPAVVGTSLTLAGVAVDASGNPIPAGDDPSRSTVSSTVASDEVGWDSGASANTVTFSQAGLRTLTVAEGGVSTTVSVRVTAAETPAAATALVIGVLPDDAADSGLSWGVEGDAITQHSPTSGAQRVTAIPVRQGDRVQIRALAVDADGQPVGEHSDLSITSDVAGDRIEYDPSAAATWVTFEHASTHTITVSYGDVTSRIRFDVAPTAVSPVVVTHTGAAAPASGTLAYTGADESGPLGWALGLLASGAGLFVWRFRRRHG